MSTSTRSRLTREAVEAAQPQSKPYRLHDVKCPGLFLRIQPSGVKSWNVQWDRRTSVSLGKYPIVTLDMARERARKALVERDQHGAPLAVKPAKPDAATLTFRKFIADHYEPWVTAHRKAGAKNVTAMKALFETEFYDLTLEQITAAKVEQWMTRRAAAQVSKATNRRDLVRLKGALTKAVEWEILPAHPLARLKLGKIDMGGVVRYLSADENKRLLAALAARDSEGIAGRARANTWRQARDIPALPALPARGFVDHLTPLVMVALHTGLRRGELTQLTWADIDLKARRLTVQAGYAKSGKARHVPLNRIATIVLKRWKRQHPVGRVFPVGDPKKAWTNLLVEAKVADFRFHDLRHTFASRLAMASVDLYTIAELMGHSDLAMTRRYAHLSPEHRAAAVQLLTMSPRRT